MSLGITESFIRMNEYVSDTKAFILRLESRKLPDKVKDVFEQAEQGNAKIYVPAIALAELAYLSEKGRIDANLSQADAYFQKYTTVSEMPLDADIVRTAFQIDDVPELQDRLIAASGKLKDCPLLTNDPDLASSMHISIIWKSSPSPTTPTSAPTAKAPTSCL
jgi:predicted nucleic acid-binding protein